MQINNTKNKRKLLMFEKCEVSMTDEQGDQRGADQSWNDSVGGLKHLPYGQNDLRAVWKLKHIFSLRSVSPIRQPHPVQAFRSGDHKGQSWL